MPPTASLPPTHVPTDTRAPRADAAATWCLVLAWVLAGSGVADLVRWGNRWYLSEVFTPLASTDGGWAYAFDLLHKAHEALVRGLVLLALAALLVAIARRLRRGGGGPPRPPPPP